MAPIADFFLGIVACTPQTIKGQVWRPYKDSNGSTTQPPAAVIMMHEDNEAHTNQAQQLQLGFI